MKNNPLMYSQESVFANFDDKTACCECCGTSGLFTNTKFGRWVQGGSDKLFGGGSTTLPKDYIEPIPTSSYVDMPTNNSQAVAPTQTVDLPNGGKSLAASGVVDFQELFGDLFKAQEQAQNTNMQPTTTTKTAATPKPEKSKAWIGWVLGVVAIGGVGWYVYKHV